MYHPANNFNKSRKSVFILKVIGLCGGFVEVGSGV
jgi:hypothetical protein